MDARHTSKAGKILKRVGFLFGGKKKGMLVRLSDSMRAKQTIVSRIEDDYISYNKSNT